MRFLVPDRARLPEGAIDLAYLANFEESPYPAPVRWQDNTLVLQHHSGESGALTIPWLIGDRPPIALTTGTLIDRPRPYLLPLELARGTLHRLQTYAFVWRSHGLVVPEALASHLRRATKLLGQAATSQDRPLDAADFAEEALELSLVAGGVLCAAYAEQAQAARRGLLAQAPILVGVPLDNGVPNPALASQLLSVCNMFAVPLRWRTIEAVRGVQDWREPDALVAWCQAHDQRICGGPLLHLDPASLPEWADLAGDFPAFQSHAAAHLQEVVARYRGRVPIWNCAAGLNASAGLPLHPDQYLRLAVQAVEVVRKNDPTAAILLTIDQPWGESLQNHGGCLSPFHLADVLVRGELGLSGFALRIDVGLSPRATLPRTVLELSRQIDRWSAFNLPILIEFTLPPARSTATGDDHDWIAQTIPVLLGKPAVQALVWGQLSDREGSTYPDRGLFDRAGQAKPGWESFSRIAGWLEK
jgi:hypothetical protein